MNINKKKFHKILGLVSMIVIIVLLLIAIIQNSNNDGVIMSPNENYNQSAEVM